MSLIRRVQEKMTALETLPRNVTEEQRLLLEIIAGPFLANWQWPRWDYVERMMATRKLNAHDVLQSLPRLPAGTSQSYGFTISGQPAMYREGTARLTIAAALVLEPFMMMVGEPYMRALHHGIKLFEDAPVSPHEVTQPAMTSAGLRGAIPSLKDGFVDALPEILDYEPMIGISGGSSNQGTWTRYIRSDVLRFSEAKNVPAYVGTVCRLVAEASRAYAPSPLRPPARPAVAGPERAPYVDADLLADLEYTAARTTAWKLHKLLALCRELNDNYTAQNAYASAALIRAVLDHIPPVFGHREFREVANNYAFTVRRTDGQHAKDLLRFRTVAHDALHRPIDGNLSEIRMVDLPEPVRLNNMLQELLRVLGKEAAGN